MQNFLSGILHDANDANALKYNHGMLQPVPYFLLFLCFRKATQEIFSELDETKAEVPIFPDTRRSQKQRWRGARGQPHHRVAQPS
jgi:hypothetical protein